jgi:NAD(P)-dependent dehydrogenase (short-subunit alcohol dehydrogenase family)
VAIVTGGSRGIGHEVARKLARLDYAVVINCAANQAEAEAAVEHPPGWPPALLEHSGAAAIGN